MKNKVPASDKHEEGGKVMSDEEEIAGEEDEEVEEIYGKVSNAKVEDEILEIGVRGGERRWVGKKCGNC